MRLCVLLFLLLTSVSARAESVLDRVRQTGTIACAAEARPGFAEFDPRGQMSGLAVDLCRAVAIAVIGPKARIRFTVPEADSAFAVLPAEADIVFLSTATISERGLSSDFILGPGVFLDPVSVLLPVNSTTTSPTDLAGKTICLIIGSAAQRALEIRLGHIDPPIVRLGFREDVEMLDAYNVGRCDAAVDDATRLGEMRRNGGINRLRSKLLDEPLALTSLWAATPTSDGIWANAVGWLLHELTAPGPSSPGDAGPGRSPETLRANWRAEVESAVGSYAEMRNRHIGAGSSLKLETWPNAPWPAGLLTPAEP